MKFDTSVIDAWTDPANPPPNRSWHSGIHDAFYRGFDGGPASKIGLRGARRGSLAHRAFTAGVKRREALANVVDATTKPRLVFTVDADRRRYCIRRHAPHYTGKGEIVARGIESAEDARAFADARNARDTVVDALKQIAFLAEFATTGPGTTPPCKSSKLTAEQATAFRGSISKIARTALASLGVTP